MGGFEVVIIFLLLLFLGVPIGFALGLSSSSYIIFNQIPLALISQRMNNMMLSFPLLAVPLFIFAGNLMNVLGITEKLFAFTKIFVGRVRGGLAYVNVIVSLIFAGMSGAALADIGGLGNIEIKAMNEQGYRPEDSACVTLASSIIGPIFPPSIPMIIYAMVAQVSAIKMLIAGIIPGLLITLLLLILIAYLSHKTEWQKEENILNTKQKIKVFLNAFPALLTPIILLGGLFSGYFSPTEIASVCVFYVLFLGIFIYKRLTWHNFLNASIDTLYTAAGVMFIITTASVFAWILTVEQIPIIISKSLLEFSNSPVVLLLMINLILLVAGMFIDTGSAILIFTPIFYPITKLVGISPIHLGVIIVFNLMIGLMTPPVGMGLYLIIKISNVPFNKLLINSIPYFITLLIVLAMVTFIPQLSTWLPGLF